MDLGAVAFYVVAAITLAASLGVVVTRSVVYSALLLVAALMFTGLIYLMLLADFLALVQILIYGGTVSVLLLFALMLTRPQERPILNHRGWPLAARRMSTRKGIVPRPCARRAKTTKDGWMCG